MTQKQGGWFIWGGGMRRKGKDWELESQQDEEVLIPLVIILKLTDSQSYNDAHISLKIILMKTITKQGGVETENQKY